MRAAFGNTRTCSREAWMSLLERPEAQELLENAGVTSQTVRGCGDHLTRFLARYLRLFGRAEQRMHACLAVDGRLGVLERKTTEPIAREANVPRRGLQRFVGAGQSGDETVMGETRRGGVVGAGGTRG